MTKTDALALLLVAVLPLLGCGSCRDESVAVLAAVEGTVESRTESGSFHAAAVGDLYHVGEAVRTGGSATARVRLMGTGDVRLGPGTLLVFVPGGAEAFDASLRVETGSVIVESGETALRFETSIGPLRIEPESEVEIATRDTGTTVRVVVGRAVIESEREDGEPLDLGELDGIAITRDGEVVVRRNEDAEASGAAAESTDEDTRGPTDAVRVDIRVEGTSVDVRTGDDAPRSVAEGEGQVLVGDVISVPARSTVVLRRGAGQLSTTGEAELVVGAPDEPIARVLGGDSTLRSSEGELVVRVPGGVLTLRPGPEGVGTSRVIVDRRATQLRVSSGRLTVRGNGRQEDLTADTVASLRRDGTLERSEHVERAPDLILPAGESATIHDRSAPTAIAVTAEGCSGVPVTARVGGRRIEGLGRAVFSARPGTTRYQVACEGAEATGRVSIRREAGRAPLLRTAPRTVVDADGRPYRVLYQNLLPEVVVRWRDAPPGPYTLTIDGERRPAAEPRIALESGALREGRHTFSFRAGDGSASPEGRLEIRFDNAAPTVFIREPADGAAAPGADVTVSGQLLEGWEVSIGGSAVETDAQGRFSVTRTMPPDGPLVIRTAHPRRGIHYYLRHPSNP